MRIKQNMDSLNIYQSYKKSLNNQSKILNRISTGQKINGSKDNPNKLGQSENFRMQIRGLQSAQKNIQDGVSMMQVTDGGLESIGNALVKINELVIQAGNGTYSDIDLNSIQLEIEQLKEHINDTSKNTNFNGVNLINNRAIINNDDLTYKTSMIGSNVKDEIKIPTFNITTDGLRDSYGNTLSQLDVTNIKDVDKNLSVIDSAMLNVNSVRSKYGAIQNRMQSSYDNVWENVISLEKADSGIRDADIGFEMAEYAKVSLLQEASTALLAQTNKFPSEILSILERVK